MISVLQLSELSGDKPELLPNGGGGILPLECELDNSTTKHKNSGVNYVLHNPPGGWTSGLLDLLIWLPYCSAYIYLSGERWASLG